MATKKPIKKKETISKKDENQNIPKFSPCSEKQRMILQDKTTDVILIGGGKLVPPL